MPSPSERVGRGPRTGDAAARGAGILYPAIAVWLGALAVGGCVVVAGADAYWLCVPVAVLGGATCHGRVPAALLAAMAMALAAAPALLDPGLGPLPPAVPALAVPVLSASVARLMREQLEAGQAALRALATIDALTGLCNRRALDDRLAYEVARHKRHHRSFALIVVDLDGFKAVNERFGHTGGDELLADVGLALQRAVREQDTVARLGGDEFCVLAPETSREEAGHLLARLRQAIAAVTSVFEGLSASVGCAVFPEDGADAGAVMAAADSAQAEDKRRRRRERERLPLPAAA